VAYVRSTLEVKVVGRRERRGGEYGRVDTRQTVNSTYEIYLHDRGRSLPKCGQMEARGGYCVGHRGWNAVGGGSSDEREGVKGMGEERELGAKKGGRGGDGGFGGAGGGSKGRV
jgi:hypothetical protein